MKALALLLIGCLCAGTAHSRSLNQVGAGPAALAPAATAAPLEPAAVATPATPAPAAGLPTTAAGPAAKPAAAAPTKPVQPDWVQRDGYVPLPKILDEEPAEAPAKAPALPPANNFGMFSSEPPPADPTGTNVFSDPKYAPAAVRAAYEAEGSIPESNIPATMAPAPAGALNSAMPPAGASDSVFATAQNGGAGVGGMTPPSAAGDSVFANAGSGFNNRYTPSVGNAIGSSDLVLKMVVDAPEQQVATSGDALRGMLANITQTPAARIFVYQTRTINSAAGQPSVDLSLLFKNDRDVDRTRQLQVLSHNEVMSRFAADVAKQTNLKINPSSIKASSAVNDGSAMGMGAMPAASGTMMPGQLPGAMPGVMPGMMNATAVPDAAAAAAPAPANAAGQATLQLAVPLLVWAALAML